MADVKVIKDVVYGQGGGRDLRLDCYEPGGDRFGAAVILIHGGGWSRGERGQLADHARFLAREGSRRCRWSTGSPVSLRSPG